MQKYKIFSLELQRDPGNPFRNTHVAVTLYDENNLLHGPFRLAIYRMLCGRPVPRLGPIINEKFDGPEWAKLFALFNAATAKEQVALIERVKEYVDDVLVVIDRGL